jgi:hypothetical protein
MVDREHIQKQFFAALCGIADKKATLLDTVAVPGYGTRVRIDKSLQAAANYLDEIPHQDHFDCIQRACETVGIPVQKQAMKMNEFARAIFDALRSAMK